MKHLGNKVEDLKIAYIGGGSRGWAWGLMSDLASAKDISGEVALYDIDHVAAEHNAIIGNKFNDLENANSKWDYKVYDSLQGALTGADFVIISILPGTFDEMESDVHAPEKYGIYQSVGDTVGPGGIIRALRTIPMFEEIGNAIKNFCPKSWVINYTNPMTVCVKTLYKVFPEIKAFGCCHEVFGTQKLLADALKEICGIEDVKREEIKVNVVGINHYTWITEAKYRDIDLFDVYKEFSDKYFETGYTKNKDDNWFNKFFDCTHRVKFDLFKKYGYIAAAGDRHLAEFNEGKLYLESPETVEKWGFGLTPVSFRKNDLKDRLEKSRKKVSGEENVEIAGTGEDGVNQIRALLGLEQMVTNVNIPNKGQIPNLPIDAVVETNAAFRDDSVTPVFAGNIPIEIYGMIARIVAEQETVVEAGLKRDLSIAYRAFINDPLVTISEPEAKALFDEMVENTKSYLGDYLK
ncbi:MAG: alpha-glucosidase/alpha-galactosidase [Acutalibacteraceae bacterium]|nr:alpha-glucosidase/alpha-galactosidase [Acutalibacteraceae bacterium]